MREMMELGCGPWLDYDQSWSVVQGSQTRHESPRSINKRAVSSNCLTELLTHNTSTCDHQIRIMNSQLCRWAPSTNMSLLKISSWLTDLDVGSAMSIRCYGQYVVQIYTFNTELMITEFFPFLMILHKLNHISRPRCQCKCWTLVGSFSFVN